MKYPLIIHKDINSDYGVTIPDLPGCFSAGSTLEMAIENSEEAILTHIEGLLIDNEDIPEPKTIEYHKNKNKQKNIINIFYLIFWHILFWLKTITHQLSLMMILVD